MLFISIASSKDVFVTNNSNFVGIAVHAFDFFINMTSFNEIFILITVSFCIYMKYRDRYFVLLSLLIKRKFTYQNYPLKMIFEYL